jgi:hypothetical protein
MTTFGKQSNPLTPVFKTKEAKMVHKQIKSSVVTKINPMKAKKVKHSKSSKLLGGFGN